MKKGNAEAKNIAFGGFDSGFMEGKKEMRKVITISNKEYSMKSSAYTPFKYKNDTGHRLLDDIQKISVISQLKEEEQIGKIDDVLDLVLRIAYIMIEEADAKQVSTYEDFLKGIDGLFDTTEWINDVIELATSPISRGLQTHPQE